MANGDMALRIKQELEVKAIEELYPGRSTMGHGPEWEKAKKYQVTGIDPMVDKEKIREWLNDALGWQVAPLGPNKGKG